MIDCFVSKTYFFSILLRLFTVLQQGPGIYLSFRFFQFYYMVSQDNNSESSLFLLLIITTSGRPREISRSDCISKSLFGRDTLLCMYHLFVWSNFNSWHSFSWITLPTLSFLVLFSVCASFLYLLVMWLIVSSLSLHNLQLLFYGILSLPVLIWLLLIAWF